MNIKEFMLDNEDHYNDLRENLVLSEGVRLAHVFHRDSGTPKGGLTIAYKPLYPDLPNCRSYLVTVVYCSKHDVFSKKVGNYLALSQFASGNYTNFNLGTRVPPDFVGSHLKQAFSYGINEDGCMR